MPEQNIPTLEELNAFIDRLKGFDWFYGYSDDGGVWRRGKAGHEQLQSDAAKNPYFAKLMTSYSILNFNNGGNWEAANVRCNTEVAAVLAEHAEATACRT